MYRFRQPKQSWVCRLRGALISVVWYRDQTKHERPLAAAGTDRPGPSVFNPGASCIRRRVSLVENEYKIIIHLMMTNSGVVARIEDGSIRRGEPFICVH